MIKLTYILTTFNKIEYLKYTLPLLIKNCGSDEEIVVTDGASTDGSVELINEFYKQGKIHQFISEKDFGEAHGYNKALFMAKGELIKIITDDDVFEYGQILKCRQYMEEHLEIDLLATNGAGGVNEEGKVVEFGFEAEFRNWLRYKTPFTFTCLGLMIRKSSLPLVGLLNTGFKRVDAEFGFRVTSSRCRMAWYTGIVWFHVGNDNSNSHKFQEAMETEMKKLIAFYVPDQNKSVKTYIAKIFHKSKKIWCVTKSGNSSGIQRVTFETAVQILHYANQTRLQLFIA